MDITEIVLLIAGGIIFILSFLIPEKKGEVSEQSKDLVKEEIADMVSREMESIRGQVDGVVEEAVTYAMEKTERSLERLSNEKIMAVNEYSDTVLGEIHKNHEEAMFLYDMLNNKHTNLKNTVSEVNRTVKEAEEKVSSFQNLATISSFPAVTATDSKVNRGGIQQRETGGLAAHPEPAPITAIERLARAASSRTSGETAAATPPPRTSGSASVTVLPRPAQETVKGRDAVPAATGSVSFLQETDADGRNEKDRILELYHHGKSKVAIAKELGLGVGEVKLVIDLFKSQ